MSTDHPRPNPTDEEAVLNSHENEMSGEALDAAQSEGEKESTDENVPETSSRWKRGFVWVKKSRITAGILGGILLLGIISGITLSLLGSRQSSSKGIQEAMAALRSGDRIQAKKMAKMIVMQSSNSKQDSADAAFVLAMSAADDAEAGWPDDQSSYTLAAHYFDVAYPSGFPEKYRFAGLKNYGKSLLHCRRYSQSRKVLEEALKIAKGTHEKNEIRYLLVEADLATENSDLTKAIRENETYLKTKDLSESERTNGLIQRLQLQTHQGQFAEARATLESIPKTASFSEKTDYAKGLLAMREAEEELAKGSQTSDLAKKKFKEAIDSFRRAQGHANESSPTVPKSQYLIGVCLEQLGENQAAIRQWKQICEYFPDSHEAVASEYRLAKIYFHEEAGQETPVEAIHYLKQVMKSLEKKEYTNPWFNNSEVREDAIRRIETFQKEEKLGTAIGLAEAVAPLVSKLQSLRLLATLNRDLGQSLLDQLKPNMGGETQELQRRQAREYFRKASLLFNELSKLEKTTHLYSDDLWQSAECSLKGSDFKRAIRTYIQYLNTEPEKRNAGALLGLGEAYLSLGEVDEAIDTFQQCIEFYPKDVATFRARLLAAEAWQEKGDFKPAEQLLLENWAAPGITPQSLVWRESLYRLGELYHNTKEYDKAIQRLNDAVRRFPEDPRTNLARYLLANCYRLRADAAQDRVKKTMTRSKLSAEKANIENDLNAAYHQYMTLQQQIGSQRGMGELSEMDVRLLRNSRVFAAGVLFQQKQYEPAIKAYANASLHYQGQPISIQTMKQNAQALSDKGENVPAEYLLRRILSQLEKMGPDLPYGETTLYQYDEWAEAIRQMEKEIAMKKGDRG